MTDSELPPGLTPELMNSLLKQQRAVNMVDQSDWLKAELTRLGLGEHYQQVNELFAGMLGAPYVFLDTYPGGAVNSAALWGEHDREILRQNPWLDADNHGWACGQSRYYAWHDGLVRS
jgi:hypothetical protein